MHQLIVVETVHRPAEIQIGHLYGLSPTYLGQEEGGGFAASDIS